jgi:hypothetical protein
MFNAVVSAAVDKVRTTIGQLSTSRKADEYAPGAIHALRKLCEDEADANLLGVYRPEVEEWRDCLFQWFDRVKS